MRIDKMLSLLFGIRAKRSMNERAMNEQATMARHHRGAIERGPIAVDSFSLGNAVTLGGGLWLLELSSQELSIPDVASAYRSQTA